MANGNEPATKADLHQLEQTLAESIHDSETRLLKAFYTFAESNQQRRSQVEGNTKAVISRLATLEVEKRLNMPPAA